MAVCCPFSWGVLACGSFWGTDGQTKRHPCVFVRPTERGLEGVLRPKHKRPRHKRQTVSRASELQSGGSFHSSGRRWYASWHFPVLFSLRLDRKSTRLHSSH